MGVAASIWIAELIVSQRTAEKLIHEHHLTEDEVRDQVVAQPGLVFSWHDHPERGRRAILNVTIRSRVCLAVLYPVEHPMGDVWALGSCYPL